MTPDRAREIITRRLRTRALSSDGNLTLIQKLDSFSENHMTKNHVEAVNDRLLPGEEVIWSQRPTPPYAYAETHFWSGVFFLACVLLLMFFDPLIVGNSGFNRREIISTKDEDYYSFKIVLLFFNILISAYFFMLAYSKLHTMYIITNKRIMILFYKTKAVKIYNLKDFRFTDWRGTNELGDLTFYFGPPLLRMRRPFERYQTDFESETLYGIKDPKHVQDLITDHYTKILEKDAGYEQTNGRRSI